jgi:hypothetical protein
MKYVIKAVRFNLTDAHQRELYEWCTEQSSNFSGFVKDVLFAHKQNNRQFSAVARITDDGNGGDSGNEGIGDIL